MDFIVGGLVALVIALIGCIVFLLKKFSHILDRK